MRRNSETLTQKKKDQKTGRFLKTHGCRLEPTPTYYSWSTMLSRCRNNKGKDWNRYGGRGITVCRRWFVFANFLKDMGERPLGTTLDRFPDNEGNYEPSNCRWATYKQQAKQRKLPQVMRKDSASGYKGVYWWPRDNNWNAKITVNGKTNNLGYFPTAKLAATAYDTAAIKHFKERACTNEMLGILSKKGKAVVV
jgi:hypothetical protein